MHASSTSAYAFVYFTVQYCIDIVQHLYFKPRMPGSKHKNSGDVAGTAKKRQVITMETKVKIIERVQRGEKMVDIACSYNMNRSTIGTILKNKDKTMKYVKSAVPVMLTVIPKKRGKVMEEMEKLLSVWMQDWHQYRVPAQLNADSRES